MRAGVASPCTNSGTTCRPAIRFGMPMNGTRTNSRAKAYVSGARRYTITIGRSSSAASSVAVPDATRARSAACTTS